MLHSRIDRVASQIKAEVSRIIDQKLKDPRIPPLVTVHSVKVAKDLGVADVDVTFLEDDSEEARTEALKALNQSAGYIRTELGRAIRLKYIPSLRFHYNPSTHYAADLERLFHEIDRDAPPPGDDKPEAQ